MSAAEKNRRVADLMSREPICISPHSSASELAKLFSVSRLKHIPVVDEGHLMGIVSDRDIRTVRGKYLRMDSETNAKPIPLVADFCETDVITVCPDDDIVEAVDLLLRHNIGALPVVDKRNRILGILSYTDVLREFRDCMREERGAETFR